MKRITKDCILQKSEWKKGFWMHFIFMITGVFTLILPVITLHEICLNLLYSELFMAVCFALPFGYIFGFRGVIEAIQLVNTVNSGNYVIEEDYITEKFMGSSSDSGLVCFDNFYNKYKKQIGMFPKEFNSVNIGDKYYIVEYKKKKRRKRQYIAYFNAKKYCI